MRSSLVLLALSACNYRSPSPAPSGGDEDDPTPDATVLPDPDDPTPEPLDPTAGIEWFIWDEQQPALGQSSWGTQLTDIARHLPASYGSTYWDSSATTAAHETSHGIHAHLRNYEAPNPFDYNAFYVLDNKVAFVLEPNMRKSDVKPHLPTLLHGDRYDLYIEGQVAWDDTPLYIFDEWNAYLNGAEVGVGQVQAGLYTGGWTDVVMGPLEFTVYAIATAKAAQTEDPDYFATNLQFRRFTAWNIARAMRLFDTGRGMIEFEWDRQDAYATALRTSPDAEALRQFARDTWGAEWTLAVLGF